MRTARRIRRFIRDELLEGTEAGRDPLAEKRIDSLAVEQLIAYLEDEYGIVFRDQEAVAENFRDVRTLARLVDRKRRGRS